MSIITTTSLADPGSLTPGQVTSTVGIAPTRYPFCATHEATCVAVRTEASTLVDATATVEFLKNGTAFDSLTAPAADTCSSKAVAESFGPCDDIEVRVSITGGPLALGVISVEAIVEFRGPVGPTGPTGPCCTGPTGPCCTGPTGAAGAVGGAGGLLKFSGVAASSALGVVVSFLADTGIGVGVVPVISTAPEYPTAIPRGLRNMAIRVLTGVAVAGGTIVFDLLKNGAALPAFTVTFVTPIAAGTTLSVATAAEPFAIGDRFDLRVSSTGVAVAVNVSATVGVE